MTRLLAPLFALTTMAAPALAQEVTSYTLDNGMDVVVIEDHRAPVVVNMVWYRTGGADEPPGKSGIAHFLEHLMFKGTDDMAPGEINRVVAENGGSDNAFTSADATAYHQRVAADRLELMIQMEADRMRDLVLTEEEVATERDVILEERNMRVENSPGAILNEQMQAALFQNHPYGIPLIGWRHEMEALTREDALDFYAQYYAPNNATLVVSGDVEPEAVLAMAETHFGPLEPNPALEDRSRPKEPVPLAPRRITYEDPRVAQPYVIRSYLAPSRGMGLAEEAAALTYLSSLLGGDGATSVFGKALEFDQNIAVQTFSGYSSMSLDNSTFVIGVVPAEGVTLEEAETAMDEVLAQFMADGIDPEQFARIKTRIRASDIYARDSGQGLANRYGQALTLGLSVEDVKAWPDILQAVTPEDVMEAAAKVLQPTHSVTGWLTAPAAPAEEDAQ